MKTKVLKACHHFRTKKSKSGGKKTGANIQSRHVHPPHLKETDGRSPKSQRNSINQPRVDPSRTNEELPWVTHLRSGASAERRTLDSFEKIAAVCRPCCFVRRSANVRTLDKSPGVWRAKNGQK